MANPLYALCALLLFLAMPAPAQAVPAIQEARLDNGLRVLLMEAHNVSMVSMRLLLPAGSRFDPDGRGGTASLLATMLTDHTALHDFESWADLLDADAIQFGADVDRDGLALSLTVLEEVLPQGIKALAEALLVPGWDAARFAILKQDAVAALRKSWEDPGVRAATFTARTLFPQHPYGHRPEGDMETLAQVMLDDTRRLYDAQVRPEGAVLAVSGDVHMQQLLALLRPALGGWQGKPAQGLFDLAIPQPVRAQQVHEAMPTKQAHLAFARLGPERLSPEFFQVFVLNHVLGGGGFASLLMQEVREQRGLAYGVYSYFIPLAMPGPFIISLQTRTDQAEQAASVVRDTLRRLTRDGVTEEQLAAAKANLVGSFAQRLDSNRERMELMAMIGFYNLPLTYLANWQASVQAVDLGQVNAMARQYLNPDDWHLIRVGP